MTKNGIYFLKYDNLDSIHFENIYQTKGLKITQCFTQDMEGNIWVGTNEGLLRLKPNYFTSYEHLNKKFRNGLYSFNKDKEGNLLIGGNYFHIAIKKGNSFDTLKMPRPPVKYGEVLQIFIDSKDAYWIRSVWNGIVRWKENKVNHFHYPQGIRFTANLFDVKEDLNGAILLATDYGITKIIEEGEQNNFKIINEFKIWV